MHGTRHDARFLRGGLLSLAWALTVGLVAAIGCSGADDNPGSTSSGRTRSGADEIDLQHPLLRINTNAGAIVVKLDAERAPGTVRNFLNYVNDGFYANTLFHYVAPDKMILGGGYTADGQPKPTRPPIRNEAHGGWKNTRGTIAMTRDAAAGIDSATSQFFINLADNPSFDHRGETSEDYGYCVFGEVVEGLDVADKISRSSTRDRGGDLAQAPDPPVIIQSIEFDR